MMNDFQILEDFLQGPRPEAGGREMIPISPELRGKLERLLRHELTEEQRKELWVEVLGQNTALELLARMIQKRKAPDRANP
jgi:hypothetical protein